MNPALLIPCYPRGKYSFRFGFLFSNAESGSIYCGNIRFMAETNCFPPFCCQSSKYLLSRI